MGLNGVPTYPQVLQPHAPSSGDWPALHFVVSGHSASTHSQGGKIVIVRQGPQNNGIVQPIKFCLGSAKVVREHKFVLFYLGNMDHLGSILWSENSILRSTRPIHCPPLLTPGQGSMTIFNVWFLILQSTSFDRIWPKVNLFWSDFREKCIFRVF